MKIVSLQSVGLGAAYTRGDGEQIITPYGIYVGTTFLYSDGNYSDAKVTEIGFGGISTVYDLPRQNNTYFVYTSDGHIRVLPADKYIAEWSE